MDAGAEAAAREALATAHHDLLIADRLKERAEQISARAVRSFLAARDRYQEIICARLIPEPPTVTPKGNLNDLVGKC